MNRAQIAAEKLADCFDKAQELYGKMPKVVVHFDLRGKAAGTVQWLHGDKSKMTLRLNLEMGGGDENSWLHVLNNTIPHEMAHVVCIFKGWDEGHGYHWQRVCLALGGNGQQYHKEKVVFARGETWEYVATCGNEVRVSGVIHRKIQAGNWRVLRSTGGKVTKECPHKLIAG